MDGGSLPCLSSLVWWRASSGGGGDVQLGEPLAGEPSRAPRSRRGTSANILLSLSLSLHSIVPDIAVGTKVGTADSASWWPLGLWWGPGYAFSAVGVR